MAKDLPYFKFFCSEWTDGDITLESLEVQGLFINICSYYWSNECDITLDKLKKKFRGNDKAIDLLIGLKIIKIKSNLGEVIISFLDEQRGERKNKSITNSLNGSKGGRPKKETQIKPNALSSLSETKGIKKREEEKRREKKEKRKRLFDLFWAKYPRKVAKQKCKTKFMALSTDEIEQIKKTLTTFIKYKPFMDYTHPNPETYLNQKRWEDEFPEEKGNIRNGINYDSPIEANPYKQFEK